MPPIRRDDANIFWIVCLFACIPSVMSCHLPAPIFHWKLLTTTIVVSRQREKRIVTGDASVRLDLTEEKLYICILNKCSIFLRSSMASNSHLQNKRLDEKAESHSVLYKIKIILFTKQMNGALFVFFSAWQFETNVNFERHSNVGMQQPIGTNDVERYLWNAIHETVSFGQNYPRQCVPFNVLSLFLTFVWLRHFVSLPQLFDGILSTMEHMTHDTRDVRTKTIA